MRRDDRFIVPDDPDRVKRSHLSERYGKPEPGDPDRFREYARSTVQFLIDALTSPDPRVMLTALGMLRDQGPIIDELLGDRRQPRRWVV